MKYDEESAIKLCVDYKKAQKAVREEYLKRYLNTRKTIEVGGLHVEVIITDIKFSMTGQTLFGVKPIAGEKNVWVDKFIN